MSRSDIVMKNGVMYRWGGYKLKKQMTQEEWKEGIYSICRSFYPTGAILYIMNELENAEILASTISWENEFLPSDIAYIKDGKRNLLQIDFDFEKNVGVTIAKRLDDEKYHQRQGVWFKNGEFKVIKFKTRYSHLRKFVLKNKDMEDYLFNFSFNKYYE